MQKKEIKGLNEYLYYEKAKNGLEIYLWQNPNSHNTYASINVKYGSLIVDWLSSALLLDTYSISVITTVFAEFIVASPSSNKSISDIWA